MGYIKYNDHHELGNPHTSLCIAPENWPHGPQAALASLAHCELCPRRCGVDRLAGKQGVCKVGAEPVVASWNVHRWEEPPISGTNGSGTVFFSGCTGQCRFCQNYPISQFGYGNRVTNERLAEMMLELQRRGCHNINFVTPTHFVPQILAAVNIAAGQGLRVPLVYNTSGYETAGDAAPARERGRHLAAGCQICRRYGRPPAVRLPALCRE